MAWNPAPEVAVARDASKRLKARMAVIIYFTDDGRIGAASYGRDTVLCGVASQLGDRLFESAMKWHAEEK